MTVEIKDVRAMLEDGTPIFYKEYRDDIVSLSHNEAKTEAEFVELLECFVILRGMAAERFEGEQLQKIYDLWNADYGLMILNEAMEGDTLNPALNFHIMQREVAAGRKADDAKTKDDLEVAKALAAVVGDPLKNGWDSSKGNNIAKGGFVIAVVLALLQFFGGVGVPGWLYALLIIGGFIAGYYVNKQSQYTHGAAIDERRKRGEIVKNGEWVRYSK